MNEAQAWAVTITEGDMGPRLRFARPVWEIEMSPDKARELGAALLLAAEGREPGRISKTEGAMPEQAAE